MTTTKATITIRISYGQSEGHAQLSKFNQNITCTHTYTYGRYANSLCSCFPWGIVNRGGGKTQASKLISFIMSLSKLVLCMHEIVGESKRTRCWKSRWLVDERSVFPFPRLCLLFCLFVWSPFCRHVIQNEYGVQLIRSKQPKMYSERGGDYYSELSLFSWFCL